jgi:asparagine synthase (glutamine-hydrolysing)
MKIRGLTEKYLLREAAKPVITDTVYRRQKHPFLSPPVTMVPTERFYQMLQDTLRGPLLSSLPFYDKKSVIKLLDRVPEMSTTDRISWDPILMSVLSACVIHKRFQLGAGALEDGSDVQRLEPTAELIDPAAIQARSGFADASASGKRDI